MEETRCRNPSKIYPPNHPNPIKITQKFLPNPPQAPPKWSRKPPNHEERQIAATKARSLPKLLRSPQAIRSLLGSKWAQNLMKKRGKINCKKNIFFRVIFSW